MKIFGPVTIKYGETLLPDTIGGVDVNFITEEVHPINGYYSTSTILLGGGGMINFYSWPSTFDLSADTALYDYGVVTMESTVSKVTFYSCKLEFATDGLSIGTLTQQPIKIKMQFKPDANGKIIKLEDV